VIVSYRDKRTEDFAKGKRIKVFASVERRAEIKLDQLDSADSLRDLEIPGNRLDSLKGDRKGSFSIRINDQWRVCFS
jgi:proteic killer suppression protein